MAALETPLTQTDVDALWLATQIDYGPMGVPETGIRARQRLNELLASGVLIQLVGQPPRLRDSE